MNGQGGDEFRLALGSSNNGRTRKSLRRANRNAAGRSEDDGLGMGACGHKEVGTQEGSHSININGGGTAVIHTQENHSVINRSSMGQSEDHDSRIASSNYNFIHAQVSPCLVDRNAESHPEDRGPGITGINSHVIQRWENPDSAGGRAVSDPWEDDEGFQLCEEMGEGSPKSGNC